MEYTKQNYEALPVLTTVVASDAQSVDIFLEIVALLTDPDL